MKEYKKLKIPNESAWDKKSYDPIKWLYHLREEQPEWLDNYFFDPYFTLKNFIKEFFRFIIKMFRWIPIIWKDRDYDDYFIFEILKKKILQQRNYLVSNNRHTNIQHDNFWMTVCLNLIERIQENHYEFEHMDFEESTIKFIETGELSGEESSFFEENYKNQKLYRMDKIYVYDNTSDYINKYPLDRDKVLNYYKIQKNLDLSDFSENQSNREKLCIYMSGFRHKKAIRVLFLILNEKIENWWD